MREGRRARTPELVLPLGAVGLTVRLSPDPEAEARTVQGAGVAVIRSARDGRALYHQLGIGASAKARGAGGRSPDRRTPPPGRPTRSGSAPDAVVADAVGPDAVGPDDVGPDAMGPDAIGPDAVGPDAVGPDAPSVGAAPVAHLPASTSTLDFDEARLRASAAAADHWALEQAREDERALAAEARRFDNARFGSVAILLATALPAVLAPGAGTGLAMLGAAAMATFVDLHGRRAALAASGAAATASAIKSSLLIDQGLPASALGSLLPWPDLLASLDLSPVGPESADEAIAQLRRRAATRQTVPAPDHAHHPGHAHAPVPEIPEVSGEARGGEVVDSLSVIDLRDTADPTKATGPNGVDLDVARRRTVRRRPEIDLRGDVGGSLEAVVVVDAGLHVGQRVALRDVAVKLATRVPVVVLATYPRHWQAPRRA